MKILAIGGHADDVELGLGGTITRHASQHDVVHILLVTHSAYEDYTGKLIRSKEQALKESIDAARVMGVNQENIVCLGYETKLVEFNAKLIEDLNREIDKIKPDIIYTHWDGDINQDHSAISKATIVAGRNIPRILMYQSNWYKTTKQFDGNFYADITDFIDTKINAIKAHKSEFDKRGDAWPDFFRNNCRNSGLEIGVQYAEKFQVFKWII